MKRVKIFDVRHLRDDLRVMLPAKAPTKRVSTGSPTLDWIIKRGLPRERWAIEYLRRTHGHVPKSITAEELGEVVPAEIADEIALLYFDELGAMHFDIPDHLIQKSETTQ